MLLGHLKFSEERIYYEGGKIEGKLISRKKFYYKLTN